MSIQKYLLCASFILIGFSVSCMAASQVPEQTAAVKYRKNIDELTKDELKAYIHAVAMMKKKSQNNIYDRTGFLWQAWVHNCNFVDVLDNRQASLSPGRFNNLLDQPENDSCNVRNFIQVPGSAITHLEHPGECEHQKNTFLQWHRAELYYYEKALQAADPEGKEGPSTKDVTLPFWNFTQKPSGVRYPKAFEDPESVLYDTTRNPEQLVSVLPTSSPYLLAYLLYYDDWNTFGGDALGTSGGGSLETKIHNQMHATYIEGNMGDNITAGLDPIFYVFHNFLDYSFEKWIIEHGSDKITGSGRNDYMRSEQALSLPAPEGFDEGTGDKRQDADQYTKNMGQAKIYFDIKKQGYGFQPSVGGDFIAQKQIQSLIDKHQKAGFEFGNNPQSLFSALLSYGATGANAEPNVKLTIDYTISQKILDDAVTLIFKRKSVTKDYSFQADVYLHPGKENIASKAFRDRYLVTNTAHWGLTGHHSGGSIAIKQPLTNIVNSLVKNYGGKQWQITVAISGEKVIKSEDFLTPTVTP